MDFDFGNNDNNEKNKKGNLDVGFICFIVFVVFLILKLVGVVDWNWVIVCIPLFVLAGFAVLLYLITLVSGLITVFWLKMLLNKVESENKDKENK